MLPIIHKKIRKDKEKGGKCPIILQVYFNNQRKQIFTGLFIDPQFWDETKEQAKQKAKDADWINRQLKNKLEETEKGYFKQSFTNNSIDLAASKKQSRESFYDYAIAMYEGMKNTASPEYINKAKTAIKDFKKFAGPQTLQSITAQMLKEFQDHLFSEGLGRNTINGKFKRIKQVYKQAQKEKLTDHNPFDIFQTVTYKQPKRSHLTVEEIEKIKDAKLPESLEHIRNYFLLACYTGLRFSDAKKFNQKEFIINNNGVERIIAGTTKTGEIISLKVNDNIREAISKLNKPLPSNIHTNRLLKTIGEVAGIKTPLSFHISRHSAAVNLASAGVPIEATARILGHTSIRTTAIYYKITDRKLDDYMDTFDTFMNTKG